MKKFLWLSLALVALAQLYVPAKMILGRENVLKEGKEFLFKTAPIDPNDPFRGKYVVLNYTNNEFPVKDTTQTWHYGEKVFVALEKNEEGFAVINNVTKELPEEETDYVQATIGYVNNQEKNLFIDFPFNRFYMEEYKAPEAERVYREVAADSARVAYAVVKIKDGEAVIADVMIDGKSLKDITKKNDE